MMRTFQFSQQDGGILEFDIELNPESPDTLQSTLLDGVMVLEVPAITKVLADTLGLFLGAIEFFSTTPPNPKAAIGKLYLALEGYKKVPDDQKEIFKNKLMLSGTKKRLDEAFLSYIQDEFGKLPSRFPDPSQDPVKKKQILNFLQFMKLYHGLGLGTEDLQKALIPLYSARSYELLGDYQKVYDEVLKINRDHLVDQEKVFCIDLFRRTCQILQKEAEFKKWRGPVVSIDVKKCLSQQEMQGAWNLAVKLCQEEMKQKLKRPPPPAKKRRTMGPSFLAKPDTASAPTAALGPGKKRMSDQKKLVDEKLALVADSFKQLKNTIETAETIKNALVKSLKNSNQSLKKSKAMQESIAQIKNLSLKADTHFAILSNHHKKVQDLHPDAEVTKKLLDFLTQAKALAQQKSVILTATQGILEQLQKNLDKIKLDFDTEKAAFQEQMTSANSPLRAMEQAMTELDEILVQARAIVVKPRYLQQAQSDFQKIKLQAQQKIEQAQALGHTITEKMTAAHEIEQKIRALESKAKAEPSVALLAEITTIEEAVKTCQQKIEACDAALQAKSTQLDLSVQAESKKMTHLLIKSKMTQVLIKSKECMAAAAQPKGPVGPPPPTFTTTAVSGPALTAKLKSIGIDSKDFDELYKIQEDLGADVILFGAAATAIAFAMSQPDDKGLELLKALPFADIDFQASVPDIEKAQALFRTKHRSNEKHKETLKVNRQPIATKFYSLEKTREGRKKLDFLLMNSGKIVIHGHEMPIHVEGGPSCLPVLNARIHLLKKPPFSPEQLARFDIAELEDGRYIGLEKNHGLMLQFKQRSHLLIAHFSVTKTKRYFLTEKTHIQMQAFITEDQETGLTAADSKYFMTYDAVRANAMQEMKLAFQHSDTAFYSRYLEIIRLLKEFKQIDHPVVAPYTEAFFTCLIAHFQPNLIHEASKTAASIMGFLKDYYQKNNLQFLPIKTLRTQFNFIARCSPAPDHEDLQKLEWEKNMDQIIKKNARRIGL